MMAAMMWIAPSILLSLSSFTRPIVGAHLAHPAYLAGSAPLGSFFARTSGATRGGMTMTLVNFKPSGKSAEVPGGTKLSLAAYRAGVSIAFNCKLGTCSTCEVLMNGRKVRTCVTNVPPKGTVTVVTPR